ncbi:zinc-binding alcohol dehydrogenase family protein [Zhouia spongiae]|uniref:Zinc-binding alcohol dehydrogenase family protein n=1 Tax=Zhouia spongiae TaxID=2202721 RepID=A0ABY3YI78_9FLAO|nr:zinc-binding alcohol dehydrogenase family protein [Zhouia spongiae]UNY97236.1 zinc-binding alcohol dehydrogenase family protein [Zhouia spongiae]
MKYIVCEKPGDFLLKEKSAPIRKKGEALLKVNKVGICGTDLHAYMGNQAFFTYPRILGHELATRVIEIDANGQGIKAGDKVVVMPYISCKKCIACKNGKTNCCTDIRVLGVHTDGGMQEKIVVPQDLLISANNLTDDQMAIVEPLAIGAHALRRAGVKTGEVIVVIGCGPIGIGILKQAQLLGAKTIALDVDKGRLQYARDLIGVDHVVNVANEPLLQIQEITNGDLASVVFDATGNKKALETAPDYMAHGGRYVLVGLSKGDITYNHPAIHAKEMTLMCSRNATLEDFKRVIEILPEFPTDKFITHSVHFSEMINHFDTWTNPESGVIKATVEF